jgi:S-adenosyl-L-methionine hydrolase (adenosine-forming)
VAASLVALAADTRSRGDAGGRVTSRIVTLLTDFGVTDPFVGVMKGVLLAHCGNARLVDLTHVIPPQRVADAAFWLAQAYPWFPAGSVHLAVVDPGVGGGRAALALRAGEHYFVGPDNGIFEGVLARLASWQCRSIDLGALGLPQPSRTFHGRDVFAPVAGMLAAGLAFERVGPEVQPLRTALLPLVTPEDAGALGEVVVIDHFGNLITNLELGGRAAGRRVVVEVAGRALPLVATYSELSPGACGAVVGSFGQIELVERDGSAARTLNAQRGTPVRVSW